MNRVEGINFERIDWCRRDRDVSLEELARDSGIPLASFTRLRDEGVGLTVNQLRQLATYFGRGMLFFMDEGPVNEQNVHTVAYRTIANKKPNTPASVKRLVERVEKQRELYLSLLEDADPNDYPTFQPPQGIVGQAPQVAASIVRRWLGLGEQSSFDQYRMAVEEKGLLVFKSNGYVGQWQIGKSIPILGFSLFHSECPVIVVKRSRWETKETFTLMHELGHILLHRESSIDDDDDMHSREGHEREANSFAGHLLVPDELLQQIDDAARPEDAAKFDGWLMPQRQRWGISTEAILRRLLDAGRLSREDYAAYRTFWTRRVAEEEEGGGVRMYRHREPKHIFGDRFVRTVLDALDARRITATKASAYLDGLKLTDLQRLGQHVAGV